MSNSNLFRFSAKFLGIAASGFLFGSVGCDEAPSPEAVEIAHVGVGHEEFGREEFHRAEIVECCHRRVEPRRRPECVLEGLRDRGICAPPRPGHHPDAGTRDASSDSSMGHDGGSGICGLVIQSITPSQSIPIDGSLTLDAVIADSNPDAALTFEWTSPSGSFFVAAPAIDFTCPDLGSFTYTFTVSDGVCQQSASTTVTCAARCGDGVIEPGEQCDPPQTGGDGFQCGPNCQLLTCGNGVIDPGEQCDPPQAHVCSLTCQNVSPVCGDGIIEQGEQCDPPDVPLIPGLSGQCGPNCEVVTCGNGVIEPGEQCDPPESGFCSSTCQSLSPVCGDGIVEAGEQCDPPQASPPASGQQCGPDCQFVPCGNGKIDPGEQCDPPRIGICSTTCQNVPAVCGDGIIQVGEQCDPPQTGPSGFQCGPNCQFLTCGNGIIDPGEQCDPPRASNPPGITSPLCSQTCQNAVCGNSVIDPGEQCDPPDGVTCNSQCQTILATCGNGAVDPGETCDFPNTQFCQNCQITNCGSCFFLEINGHGSSADHVCNPLSGTERTNCLALLSCMSSNNSSCISQNFQAARNLACYCSDLACSAGANGACVAQMNAVVGSSDLATVLAQLNSSTSLVAQIRAEATLFENGCGPACSGAF